MIRIEFNDAPQMRFALCLQIVIATPLGQLPLGGCGVGIGWANPLVLGFICARTKHLGDLVGVDRDFRAVVHLDHVLFAGRFVAVEPLADDAAAAGQHDDFGRSGG